MKHPVYIAWVGANVQLLVRTSHVELRSVDPMANPYCYGCSLEVGLHGIENKIKHQLLIAEENTSCHHDCVEERKEAGIIDFITSSHKLESF